MLGSGRSRPTGPAGGVWNSTTGLEPDRRRGVPSILFTVAVPDDSALVAFLAHGLALVVGRDGAWWVFPGREPVRAQIGTA